MMYFLFYFKYIYLLFICASSTIFSEFVYFYLSSFSELIVLLFKNRNVTRAHTHMHTHTVNI